MRRLILAWVLIVVCAATAWAQFETGSITGTVRDKSGGVLPGATVTLRNLATGVVQTAVTNESGVYEFFTLRVGRYEVKAELTGFAVVTLPNVELTIGARQRADVELGVEGVSEAIEVNAAAIRLERDSSQRSQVITSEQAVALPLNGREYSALMQLTTGVRRSAINSGGPASTPREGAFTVNGLRSTYNNFLLDGVDNNAYGTSNQGFSNQVMQPTPDSIAEFRVVTNNMSAEYGRSGGGTVNVAYKSGANRFSGAGWEFRRDTSLTAVGFFRPTPGNESELDRNQYGFVLGGPIARNKAFFFTDYEGFRETQRVVGLAALPTVDQRQGILSVDVRNPVTGQIYPAGTPIPMTNFARKVLSELPAPTSPGTGNNFRRVRSFETDIDKVNVKLDGRINERLSIFGRYGYRDSAILDEPVIPLPSGGSSNGNLYATNKQLALGSTYTPGGTQLFEFRFGWSTTRAGKDPLSLGTPSAQDAYGLSGLPTDPRVAGGLPTQAISGFAALGRQATNPQWQYPEVWNPKVNYSFVRGKQSIKVGYEFQHINTEVQDVNPLYGNDTYSGQFTRPVGATANNIYNLSDFYFGFRNAFALSNILVANLRQNMHFAYVQDDFRVNDKLTLNLGVRYEYATPWVEKDNRLSNFDPTTRTMILASDGSLEDRSTIQPDRNNFGPRLGFAYSLNTGTVIRGGFGTSYMHFQRAGGGNVLPINGPQVVNALVSQLDPTAATFRTTQQGYPEGLTDPSRFNPLAANITYMPSDYHSSRVNSYFVSVQRELFKNTIVDVAYVGNKSDGLLLFANFNQARPNNPGENLSLQARRPIQEFADITYSWNGGKSRYDGFQARVETRFRGLYFLNALTLSRTKDNGAGSLESPNGNFPGPQDFNNLDAEYTLSAYHQPYNLTTSVVWDVPVGRDRRFMSDASPLMDALVGGWNVSFVSIFTAGDPVTFRYNPVAQAQVTTSTVPDFRGQNTYRPNINGDPYGDKNSVTSYFNRASFTVPDVSQPFGNSQRNSVRGPDFWQVDFALQKDVRVPIGSNTKVQFRAEAFNLFNRVNFRAPDGNISNTTFGAFSSTFDPRIVQLGLRVSF